MNYTKGKQKKREMIPKIMEEYNKLVKLGFYHNDLRYKNIVYNERKDQIYLIDFEFTSTRFLDKDDEHIIKPLKSSNNNNNKNNKRSKKDNNKRSKRSKKRSNKRSNNKRSKI